MGIWVGLKGFNYVGIGTGNGAIDVGVTHDKTAPYTQFGISENICLLFNENTFQFQGFPNWTALADAGIRHMQDETRISLPTAGFLNLWLFMGLISEIRPRVSG